MRFNWKVFVVAFVFSLVTTFLSGIFPTLVYASARDLGLDYSMVYWLSIVASFVISPFLLFASFYRMGRNVDLKAEFRSVVASLFFGSWAGHFISLVYSTSAWAMTSTYAVIAVIWYGVSSALSIEFFVGFSALSMAYIYKSQTRAEVGR
jgi:hypothetical protein